MRFVAPDTNFILHFKQISEISGADIGVLDDFTWLIVGQVMVELDVRKGTGDKTLRKRARKAAREFERAETGAEPFPGKNGLAVHFRTRDFDFEANGLLRNEGDHKIIADILDFKIDHPDDEVLFLSDDASARMRARKHGIQTIEAPDALMRPEIEDERDEQLRELQRKYQAIAETQPSLELRFADDSNEMRATVESFDEEEFEDLTHQITTPEPEPEDEDQPRHTSATDLMTLVSATGPFRRPNPDYEKELANFGGDFREYFLESWIQRYRTVGVVPAIYSQNGVQATGVGVRINVKTDAEVLEDLPKAASAPRKPRRFLNIFTNYRSTPDFRDIAAMFQTPEFEPYKPSVEQNENGATIRYGFLRLPQDDVTTLNPFYLVFDHTIVPPDAIELSYEIRAQNMNKVVRGRLLMRIVKQERGLPANYLIEGRV